MSEWIKCGERVPGDEEVVIVCTTGHDVEPAWFWDGVFISLDRLCDVGDALDVAYWMPLPVPPDQPGDAQ